MLGRRRTQTADIAYRLSAKEIEREHSLLGRRGLLARPYANHISTLRPSTIDLDRLQACRAFTAHQMAEIFKRMEKAEDGESPLEDGDLLVVTSVHTMFLDNQLGVVEKHAPS